MNSGGWIVIEVYRDGAQAAFGDFANRDAAKWWADNTYNPDNNVRFVLLVNKP